MPAESSSDPENALSQLLDLKVAADSEAIATVVDSISETLTQLEVPEQKRWEVVLAVQEALANAVVHGCGNDPSKEIRCQLKCASSGRVVIIVTDPGPGFSRDIVSDPKLGENLYGDHGRGVYLIRQLMDEVHLEHGGNEIRMWKY